VEKKAKKQAKVSLS